MQVQFSAIKHFKNQYKAIQPMPAERYYKRISKKKVVVVVAAVVEEQ